MKSIKSLLNQNKPYNKIKSSLVSLHSLGSSSRQRIQTQCAFHPTEVITNFCKDPNCLLPLCPKCVKMHVEYHAQMGTLGKFWAIEDCLYEIREELSECTSQINYITSKSQSFYYLYNSKKYQIWQYFQSSKQKLYEYLDSLFRDYYKVIEIYLNKDDKIFYDNLNSYNELISEMQYMCRLCSTKLQNKNTIMYGVISFYKNDDLSLQIQYIENKINRLFMNKIYIVAKEDYIVKFGDILKRYLKVGDSSLSFYYPPQNYDNGSIEYSKIVKNVDRNESSLFLTGKEEKMYGKINDFYNVKTPLSKYSLAKSRNARLSLIQVRYY